MLALSGCSLTVPSCGILLLRPAGVNIFGHDVPLRFGGLDLAMYTLFIALTQDGWSKVFAELEDVGLFGVGSVFFFFFIMIGAFVFMNIISGVIVTNFQRAHEEFNRKRQLKFRVLARRELEEVQCATIQTREPTKQELRGAVSQNPWMPLPGAASAAISGSEDGR